MNERLLVPLDPSPEKVELMKKEAPGCDSCLLWHDFCKAECCKMVAFNVKLAHKPRIGQLLTIQLQAGISEDLKWYLELHGGNVTKTSVSFRLVRFKWNKDKDQIVIFRTCDLLTDDLKCGGHPDDKPDICKKLNLNNSQDPDYYLTPNCMFKYQKMDPLDGEAKLES